MPGYALMGGGKDFDDAFHWLCDHGSGGDFLVLRASGDDSYNPYIQKLWRSLRCHARHSHAKQRRRIRSLPMLIRHAAVIFISGGDQAKYVNNWAGTPVS